MRVEFTLFEGDDLLDRGEVQIGAAGVDLKRVTLDMPIHQSADWESIELGRYTLAFWSRLDA
jgi:hypothetical protein